MPFSLRLDRDTEAIIRRLSAATGRSKSAVVREAVALYAPTSARRLLMARQRSIALSRSSAS